MTNTKTKILYKDLSFKLIGLAFKVYNELGPGFQEKVYQKAYEIELKTEGVNYDREKFVILEYYGERVGKYFIDFIIENKVVLEFKACKFIHSRDIKQILNYLKVNNIKLGILINFSSEGVQYKRIINSDNSR